MVKAKAITKAIVVFYRPGQMAEGRRRTVQEKAVPTTGLRSQFLKDGSRALVPVLA